MFFLKPWLYIDAIFCCNPTAYQLIPRSYVTQGAHYTNLLVNFLPGQTDQSRLYTDKTTDFVMFAGMFEVSTEVVDLVDRANTITLPWYRGWDVFVCISNNTEVNRLTK